MTSKEKSVGVSPPNVTSISPSRQLTSPRARKEKIDNVSSPIQSPPVVLNYDPTTPSRHFPVSHVNNPDSVLRKSKIRDFLKAKVQYM